MKVSIIEIEMTFNEPVLGLSPGDPKILEKFISKNAPTPENAKEEVEAAEAAAPEFDPEVELDKVSTVFPRDDTGLFIWDYQMRGFFKEQLLSLIELGEPSVAGLSKWIYKRTVDQFLLVLPRRIYLQNVVGNFYTDHVSMLQRPLRATTMRGERICLASSQVLPPGTCMGFTVHGISGSNKKSKVALLTTDTVLACMEYGKMHGFGQWRSGGYGRYEYRYKVVAVEKEWKLAPPVEP